MFKKLRFKFIAITMAMVAIVMALSFVSVCAIERQRSLSVVETALSDAAGQAADVAARRQASPDMRRDAPEGDDGFRLGWRGEGPSPDDLDLDFDFEDGSVTGGGSADIAPPAIGVREGQQRTSSSLIPVAVYAVSAGGLANMVPEATSASISDDLLEEASATVASAPDGFGTLSGLGLEYYKVTRDGQAYVAFTDSSYSDGWRTLALMLTLVGAGTLLVFLLITLFYSKWALRPVREAWDSQRQFVADASHDLKTPITVILANAAILLKHPERTIASESQWIESTQVEAENMQGLVNEMLELASVEAGGRREVPREPIDFSDLVDGETLLFDSVALERDCRFSCEIEPGITVNGNTAQVQKMVSTIVENAFKYVDAGGSVDVTLERSGRVARLAVRNSGPSISPDDLPHIFDRFYRTDKARTSGAGGFGLGLAIAKEVAVQHGGDIACSSVPGEGTCFTITLPLA